MQNATKNFPIKKKTRSSCTFTIPLLTTLATSSFCLILLPSQAEAAGYIRQQQFQQKRVNLTSRQKPARKTASQRKTPPKATYARTYTKGVLPGIKSDNTAIHTIQRNSRRQNIPLQFASAGNLARNLPQGLRVAHKGVQTQCFKPKLLSLLGTIQRHFNQPVIITSGYRSIAYNNRVKGAKHSLHISCAAADIRVAGVHKSKVAQFVRSLPDRGGVGTYCSQQSIHVDIGSKRDWNWGCSKKR